MALTVDFLITVGGLAKEDISVVLKGSPSNGKQVVICCNVPFCNANGSSLYREVLYKYSGGMIKQFTAGVYRKNLQKVISPMQVF